MRYSYPYLDDILISGLFFVANIGTVNRLTVILLYLHGSIAPSLSHTLSRQAYFAGLLAVDAFILMFLPLSAIIACR
jgi:hypothetical protein